MGWATSASGDSKVNNATSPARAICIMCGGVSRHNSISLSISACTHFIKLSAYFTSRNRCCSQTNSRRYSPTVLCCHPWMRHGNALDRVCLSVCLLQHLKALTYKIHFGTQLHLQNIYRSSSYIKVVGLRSRSQEQITKYTNQRDVRLLLKGIFVVDIFVVGLTESLWYEIVSVIT